jgi:eukaryotic-like serine/threonine-protein kinase
MAVPRIKSKIINASVGVPDQNTHTSISMTSVTPEDWTKLTEIIAQVSALGPTEKRSAVAGLSLSPQLRRELDSLLDADEIADDFLSLSAKDFAGDLVSEGIDALVGQSIGVYRIVRELGVGGMGAV